MLKGQLLHPGILSAIASAGHGSKVLIADGNYPHSTHRGPNASLVFLNLSPGLVSGVDALKVLTSALVIEKAEVMDYARTGPYAMNKDPEIWADYAELLKDADCKGQLNKIERFAFYDVAAAPDVCLTIATGEQRIYADLLLTIGVVK